MSLSFRTLILLIKYTQRLAECGSAVQGRHRWAGVEVSFKGIYIDIAA